MRPLRIAVGVLGLALLGVVIWAAVAGGDLHGSFLQQGAVLTTLPWGLATLLDLYIGFVFFSVIVLLTERSWLRAALWAAPIFVLGNIWTAVWLVLRLPTLLRRLNQPDPS
jgi:hypothetical protein